jgi:hypothetical protein
MHPLFNSRPDLKTFIEDHLNAYGIDVDTPLDEEC